MPLKLVSSFNTSFSLAQNPFDIFSLEEITKTFGNIFGRFADNHNKNNNNNNYDDNDNDDNNNDENVKDKSNSNTNNPPYLMLMSVPPLEKVSDETVP